MHPIAKVIVAKLGAPGDEVAEKQRAEAHEDSMKSHAHDMISAHQQESPELLVKALKSFIEQCMENKK